MYVAVASVVGFTSVNGRPFHCSQLGIIQAPARGDGYYLAISTAGADLYGGPCGSYGGACIGGARSIETAADMVRRRWHFPSDSVCSWDGKYTRR